ncbi:hypothetical protein KORDIASMS9_03526 [Kordia sp. SMS9]|nr:hypothetical protein KORDIASMS9_03526 [Kordia sp. SMS9]
MNLFSNKLEVLSTHVLLLEIINIAFAFDSNLQNKMKNSNFDLYFQRKLLTIIRQIPITFF